MHHRREGTHHLEAGDAHGVLARRVQHACGVGGGEPAACVQGSIKATSESHRPPRSGHCPRVMGTCDACGPAQDRACVQLMLLSPNCVHTCSRPQSTRIAIKPPWHPPWPAHPLAAWPARTPPAAAGGSSLRAHRNDRNAAQGQGLGPHTDGAPRNDTDTAQGQGSGLQGHGASRACSVQTGARALRATGADCTRRRLQAPPAP